MPVGAFADRAIGNLQRWLILIAPIRGCEPRSVRLN